MKYTAKIAMDVRAYGLVEVEAESAEKAIGSITDEFVAENFEPHGGGDDIDYTTPVQIVITSVEDEQGEEGDDLYKSVSSRWDHEEVAMKRFIRGVEELLKGDDQRSVMDIDGAAEIYRELEITPATGDAEVEVQ